MSAESILLELCNERHIKEDRTLEDVFKIAFNEKDNIRLLNKRSILCEHCEYVLNFLSFDSDTFDDILKIVACANLEIRIKNFSTTLTQTQQRLIKSVFANYKLKTKYEDNIDFSEVIDIAFDIENSLNSANLNQEQRLLLLELCNTVKKAKDEGDIRGLRAAQSLHSRFIGKMIIYKNIVMSIQDTNIIDKFKMLYIKVEQLNKFFETTRKLYDNSKSILELLGF